MSEPRGSLPMNVTDPSGATIYGARQTLSAPPPPGPAAEIPYGPIKGTLRTLPQFGDLGQIRPFGPGEYVDLGNGGMANEMTYTTQLGKDWAVVPGLWLVNGVPTRVTEDQAAQYAQQSGLTWPTFPSEQAADQFAMQREAIWQKIPHGRTDMQQPLWTWPGKR